MTRRAVPHPALARVVLVALGAVQTLDGLYALLSPRGFYDDFPGGRGWVAAYPSYSEHLVRDVGGLFLATGVLMLLAAVWLERRILIAALTSWLLFAVPHTAYHLLNLDPLSTGDAVANAIALAATVVLPVWLLVLLARDGRTAAPRAAAAPAPPAGNGNGSGGARIALPDRPRGLVARASYRTSRRRYGMVMDPVKAFAHTPAILSGYGALELSAEHSHHAPERLKELAVMRAAMLVGCEWCLDFGTAKLRAEGITEEELRDLPRYRDSDRFSPLDVLVLDYATAMSRTPVEVPDDLVAQLREHLDDAALTELTAMVALEHLRARFNWALGIGSQGFSEGSFCVAPEPAAGVTA